MTTARLFLNAPINVKPAEEGGGGGGGEGRACGGDLIVFVGPGVGHLLDLVLQGEGIFQSFLVRCGDIRLLTRTKETVTEHVSRFHASHMRLTVWKDLEIMEASAGQREQTKGEWISLFCLKSLFVLACF